MTERLTPPMLLDLAEIDERIFGETPWSRALRREAARREAEAKPTRQVDFQWCEKCPTVEVCQIGGCNGGERKGPDSAAAPKYVATDAVLGAGQIRTATTEKANSAAADMLFYRRWDDDGRMVGKWRYNPVGFTLAEVRGVLAEAKHVLSAARLKPFLPLLKETT